MSEDKKLPYRTLGTRLKHIRERRKESIDEVSGALEIDVNTLKQIELGIQKPSEDILNLLLSYLAVNDNEADKLLTLAGYADAGDIETVISDDGLLKQMVMLMPMDSRVVYTDTVHVVVNNYGVIMNFMQNNGTGNQLAVARVGMSREHAKSVLQVLKDTLEKSGDISATKNLPPNTNNQTSQN